MRLRRADWFSEVGDVAERMRDDGDNARAAFAFGVIARTDRPYDADAGVKHALGRVLQAQRERQASLLDGFGIDRSQQFGLRRGRRCERFRFGEETGVVEVADLALALAPIEIFDPLIEPRVRNFQARGDVRHGHERLLIEMPCFGDLIRR